MSVIGIIVEGALDAALYPAIIRGIRPKVDVVARPCRGLPDLKRRFVGWLRDFEHRHPVNKALVIRDSDGKNSHDLETELRDRMNERGLKPSFPVHFYATKSEAETWLLADEHAVNAVARSRGQSQSAKPVNAQLEDIFDAKERFRRMLSEAGLPADNRVYEEIAAEADIDRIEARCPYFAEFRKQVHAC